MSLQIITPAVRAQDDGSLLHLDFSNMSVAEFEELLKSLGAEIIRPVQQDPAAVKDGRILAVWVEL